MANLKSCRNCACETQAKCHLVDKRDTKEREREKSCFIASYSVSRIAEAIALLKRGNPEDISAAVYALSACIGNTVEYSFMPCGECVHFYSNKEDKGRCECMDENQDIKPDEEAGICPYVEAVKPLLMDFKIEIMGQPYESNYTKFGCNNCFSAARGTCFGASPKGTQIANLKKCPGKAPVIDKGVSRE